MDNNCKQMSTQTILSAQQVCEQVCNYYLQLREQQLPSLTQKIPSQFINIQKKILQVVELRKSMQNVLQLEALQAQHQPTLQTLLYINQQQQETIHRLTAHIQTLQNHNMQRRIDSFLHLREQQTSTTPEIISKGHLLLMELRDFKRTLDFDHCQHSPQSDAEQYFEPEAIQDEGSWYQRRWQLARHILSVRLRQLNIRGQLLEQRQNALDEAERGNSELIDALLRQKERDKNLRKKDSQKFTQIIKQRDEIQLENENLSHSEKSLIPHLTSELLKIKNQLKQQTSNYQLHLQKLNTVNQELSKNLDSLKAHAKLEEQSAELREHNLKEKVAQLQSAYEATIQQRRIAQAQIRTGIAEAEREVERFRLRCQQLQHQNNLLLAKNEQLQSQYNELILKSSQLSHIRGELTQKFQKTSKKAQQLEAKLQQHSSKLQQQRVSLACKEDELRNLQNSLRRVKLQKEQLSSQISFLQQQLSIKKREWEERTAQLEEELTQNFILHNEERNNLLAQLNAKDTTLAFLQKQQQEEGTEALRKEILKEIACGERARLAMIDSFLDRIDKLV